MSLHNIKPVWMTSVLYKMGREIVLSMLNDMDDTTYPSNIQLICLLLRFRAFEVVPYSYENVSECPYIA